MATSSRDEDRGDSKLTPQEVVLEARSVDRFEPLLGPDRMAALRETITEARRVLEGRVLWNINSTATGGGVAEMLASLLPYVRGTGIDARWLALSGDPAFFALTKRLHHALHGSPGDHSPLGKEQHALYETTLAENAREFRALVKPDDPVILHDPQTAGLIPALKHHGATVVWRCHIGTDVWNEETEAGWRFLEPYLSGADAAVFSRPQYIPNCCLDAKTAVIPPGIDPFSVKNHDMEPEAVHAILVHVGIIEGPGEHAPAFTRGDGSPGRVDRRADIVRLGRAPSWDAPLVVQVSRWDPLKDYAGVMRGFARFLSQDGADTHLLLAGPNVHGVADDPEQADVFNDLVDAWHNLPHFERSRVHIACLPTADVEENAAIVNALQRHAAVVVQKSLAEGFGLTVTEAMWKARPVVASAVGGIVDQIEDGRSGILLDDPTDLDEFAAALRFLLSFPERAAELGRAAHQRVLDHFLAVRQLAQHADLLRDLALQTSV